MKRSQRVTIEYLLGLYQKQIIRLESPEDPVDMVEVLIENLIDREAPFSERHAAALELAEDSASVTGIVGLLKKHNLKLVVEANKIDPRFYSIRLSDNKGFTVHENHYQERPSA